MLVSLDRDGIRCIQNGVHYDETCHVRLLRSIEEIDNFHLPAGFFRVEVIEDWSDVNDRQKTFVINEQLFVVGSGDEDIVSTLILGAVALNIARDPEKMKRLPIQIVTESGHFQAGKTLQIIGIEHGIDVIEEKLGKKVDATLGIVLAKEYSTVINAPEFSPTLERTWGRDEVPHRLQALEERQG